MAAYKEPVGNEVAGLARFKRLPSPYDLFMEEQEIPIYRGIGVDDVRQLSLGPWKRTGGRGAFIEFDGQAGEFGMYVVEVPAGGELNIERHMYEELLLVIEGFGSTEVWREGSSRKQAFEWQPGTHFAIPLNTCHRLLNGSNRPALLVAATSAPAVMSMFPNPSFIFNLSFDFPERFDDRDGYFRARLELEEHPESKQAMLRTSVIPDVTRSYLPLDNQRAPGYRWVMPFMAANTFFTGFIAEYPSGRYSMAHYHQAGTILICLRGKGYTYNWPVEAGLRPWESGKGHLVRRQDYVAGGLVSAAPGGGNWFHQHFSVGKEPLRTRAIFESRRALGAPGTEVNSVAVEIHQGGSALPYRDEDPYIRDAYKEALAAEGVEFQMDESLYH